MGEVYRARRMDAEYEKEVAIKLVPAGHARRLRVAAAAHRAADPRRTRPPQHRPAARRRRHRRRHCPTWSWSSSMAIRSTVLRRPAPRSRTGCGCSATSATPSTRPPQPGGAPRPQAGNVLVTDEGVPEAPRLRHRQASRPRARRRHGDRRCATLRPTTPAPSSRRRPVTTATDVYSLGVAALHAPDRAQSLSRPPRLDAGRHTRGLRERTGAPRRDARSWTQGAGRGGSRRDHLASIAQRTGAALPVGR